MKAKILSLNVGQPQTLEWNGKKMKTSMIKTPQQELEVGELAIDGDSFVFKGHGTPDKVLYAYGLKSVMQYMALFGRSSYDPGALGENVLLDDLDEKQVSVGDVFQFGEVRAQATFPRIPCSKLDFRMQHAKGRQSMVDLGLSGIYFRILKTGKIRLNDRVERIEEAKVRFSIANLCHKATHNIPLTSEERVRALENGAFPETMIEKWRALIKQ